MVRGKNPEEMSLFLLRNKYKLCIMVTELERNFFIAGGGSHDI